MKTVELAGPGLSASRLGFGLSGIHHLLSSRARQNLLARALDRGISYYDTAPYYGHGLAERELGKFAETRRDRMVIATKVGIQASPWLRQFPVFMYPRLAINAAMRRTTRRNELAAKKIYDFRGSNAVASLDRSLRALRTDYVDILYLHEPALDRMPEPSRLFDTLSGLQSQGKIRYFGIAGNGAQCLAILQTFSLPGCLVQIDARRDSADLEFFREQSIPFHGSYGHFRAKQESVTKLLAAAVQANRHGVILFSTRRPSHIDVMVQALATMEAC